MRRLVLYPTPDLPNETPVQEISFTWNIGATSRGRAKNRR